MTDSPADEAVEFMRQVSAAESENRVQGLDDLKFRFGEQWPAEMRQSRSIPGQERPMFTINETDSYCRQVINSIRQQRPRGKAHPVNSTADIKIAKVITGIGRHIEVHSHAENAYDLAAEFAVTMGWGYFRIRNDFIREDSNDQDIYVEQLENPFAVYFDHTSGLPDGSDAEKCLITTMMHKETFRKEYPGANEQSFREGTAGDSRINDWMTKDEIRIAEYFTVEKEKQKLVTLSDKTVTWADMLPPPAVLQAVGISVVHERDSRRRKVKWSKVTAFDTLEQKVLPGRWIPIIPVYGVNMIIDGKRKRMGMVRFARDPQLMVNFWQTSITEHLAMQPKAKWKMAAGQDSGYENEWAQSNNSARSILHYLQKDVDGNEAPPPEYVSPAPVPSGIVEAAMQASQNLQRVLGMFDPVNLKHTGPKSGEAIKQEMGQSEQSNYHFYDNLTDSINHGWRIFLDYIPIIYDTERVLRVIGDDGKPDLVTVNQKTTDEQGAQKVLNDVTVGDYDVVMQTGPGFNTKRQESLGTFTAMLGTPLGEKISEVGSDLIVRMVDADGAEALADRLAAANPLAQIDDKSDVPPQAQLLIKHLQDQLQKAAQQIQSMGLEIKFKTGIEKGWMDTELKKAHLAATVKAHDVEVTGATKRHDVETRALTAQNVEELKGMVQLLLHHLETKQLKELAAIEGAQETAKANQREPLNA
jgi:Phage P22-like portal protein